MSRTYPTLTSNIRSTLVSESADWVFKTNLDPSFQNGVQNGVQNDAQNAVLKAAGGSVGSTTSSITGSITTNSVTKSTDTTGNMDSFNSEGGVKGDDHCNRESMRYTLDPTKGER